jgi:hypothetical protein
MIIYLYIYTYTYIQESVVLSDKAIRPQVEDDVICRMIHVDQIAYKAVINAARQRMTDILHSGVRERVEKKAVLRSQWAAVESLYLKQRTWRKVATTAAKGMYICVCIYIYIHIYNMYMYHVYIYIHINIYVHIYIYMNT